MPKKRKGKQGEKSQGKELGDVKALINWLGFDD